MNIHMNTYLVKFSIENQFVHPIPEGSKLIFPAPFRGRGEQGESILDLGKNSDNQRINRIV